MTEASIATTIVSAAGTPCATTLTFEALGSTQDHVLNTTESHNVTSAKDCANLCYTRGCTAAGYTPLPPPADHSICALSFDITPICGFLAPRIEDYNGTAPTEIRCIKCGTEAAGVVAATEVTRVETTPSAGEVDVNATGAVGKCQ